MKMVTKRKAYEFKTNKRPIREVVTLLGCWYRLLAKYRPEHEL